MVKLATYEANSSADQWRRAYLVRVDHQHRSPVELLDLVGGDEVGHSHRFPARLALPEHGVERGQKGPDVPLLPLDPLQDLSPGTEHDTCQLCRDAPPIPHSPGPDTVASVSNWIEVHGCLADSLIHLSQLHRCCRGRIFIFEMEKTASLLQLISIRSHTSLTHPSHTSGVF